MKDIQYVGFWVRTAAAIIDTILVLLIILPILTAYYGMSYWRNSGVFFHGFVDVFLSYIFPIVVAIGFWLLKQATPGKMLFSAEIVDEETGGKPSVIQCVGRYFAYIVALLPFGLGIIWVGIDRRKQGWHDKLAGTLVVKKVDESDY